MSVCTCCGSGEATGGYDWCQSCIEREEQKAQEREMEERQYQEAMEREMSECEHIIIAVEQAQAGGWCPQCGRCGELLSWDALNAQTNVLAAERDAALARVASLEAALKWYADPDNWYPYSRKAEIDGGAIARHYLRTTETPRRVLGEE